MRQSVIEVFRGSTIESVHHVHVAVVDANGTLRAKSGNADFVGFARSAVKPLQALPLVEDGVADHFGFTEQELSLSCASHNGEALHVEAARSMLRKVGAGEEALACGPQEGRPKTRVHNNCSGKHAGMLGLAHFYGWPMHGYHLAEHPVQQRMLAEMSRWTGIDKEDIPLAVDGCGITTFALPIRAMARAFAGFAAGARRHDKATSRIVNAMTQHPEYVGGSNRLCTDLMRIATGRIFAKVGAEGVYCAGVPGAELGIALKVEDGAWRAAEPALIAVLRILGLVADEEIAQLSRWAEPDVLNTRDEVVGGLRARIHLEAA